MYIIPISLRMTLINGKDSDVGIVITLYKNKMIHKYKDEIVIVILTLGSLFGPKCLRVWILPCISYSTLYIMMKLTK